MKTIPFPSPLSRRRIARRSATSLGARFEVGSSRMSSSTSRRIALRISTRWRRPSGSEATGASGSRSRPKRRLASAIRAAIAVRRRTRPASGQPSMTFSTTLIASTSMKCWWIMAMPAAIASRGRWPASGRPRKTMLPASGGSMPKSTFISVLLPEPFSPSSPRMRPGWTSRSMPSLALSAPKQRTIPRISRSAVMGSGPGGRASTPAKSDEPARTRDDSPTGFPRRRGQMAGEDARPSRRA